MKIQNGCSLLLLGTASHNLKYVKSLLNHQKLANLVVLAADSQPIRELTQADPNIVYGGCIKNFSHWSQKSIANVFVGSEINLTDNDKQTLRELRLRHIPVFHFVEIFGWLWRKFPPSLIDDHWFIFGDGFKLLSDCNSIKVKRFFDIVVAVMILTPLLPILALVALLIKLDSPGQIFYSQVRNGLNSEPFKIYKFRSMYQDAEKNGAKWASVSDSRITRVGYWLRVLRIDELPQIWNVLRGEMSLVGPRPERPEFDANLEKVIPYYRFRYLVKPGISGWAQVCYPYGASVEDSYEKLAYDLYYIRNYSLWLDIVIFFKTIKVVISSKGR
ncbi:MAG: sugar transferase [Pseudanabaena sp. CAN_BIN31]|nr:sugar transferase [Pseudanabaena sp. CAN_BIN31]